MMPVKKFSALFATFLVLLSIRLAAKMSRASAQQ
jgi:hypothetical protein